jgi:hypothetical protein
MPWPKYPFIINVPYGSPYIPSEERPAILLTDLELESELRLVTDLHLGDLAEAGQPLGLVHRFRYSSLVVDPELPRDGQNDDSPVHTRTSTGQLLRQVDEREKERLLARYHDPHQASFEAGLKFQIKNFGWCLIINLQTFSNCSTPTHLQREQPPVGILLGQDPALTPANLVGLVETYWRNHSIPVVGILLPPTTRLPQQFKSATNIQTLTIALNRGLYLDEITGERLPGFGEVRSLLGGLFQHLSREYLPDLK